MKRRKFIKGLAIAPAVLVAGLFLPEIKPVVNEESIMLETWSGLHGISRAPGENDSELRNRLIEFQRFEEARLNEAVVNSYFQTILKP